MEYKFRGMRVDTKEWVYGYYDGFGSYILTQEMTEKLHVFYDEHKVIPETVGQGIEYNGKWFFEGDITKSDWGYSGVVEFERFIYAKMERTISDNIEVIGTIYKEE